MARKDAMKTAVTNVRAHKAAEVTTVESDPANETVTLVIQPAGDAPMTIDPANTSATADPRLAPKEGAVPKAKADTPVAPKAAQAQAAKRAKANAAAVKVEDAENAAAMTAQWESVTKLFQDGVARPEIAKQTGLNYSRVTFILWHAKYGVNAIPGMPAYTQEAKNAAQARYEADVAAKKAK